MKMGCDCECLMKMGCDFEWLMKMGYESHEDVVWVSHEDGVQVSLMQMVQVFHEDGGVSLMNMACKYLVKMVWECLIKMV